MRNKAKFIKSLIIGNENSGFLKDICFWMLLVCINLSGNPGFGYYFPIQIALPLTAVFLTLICIKRRCVPKGLFELLLPICIIFSIQTFYVSSYSLNTTIHYILKIFMAISIVFLCGKNFARYFATIIFVYALISLVCFALNSRGIVIPYQPITENITVDGGNIYRVYNIVYTQLYNPLSAGGLTLRNCGPFWEPGAYQGFLNLALWFEMTMQQERNRFWKYRIFTLIAAIITTFSTGGYVVLFVILLFYFSKERSISFGAKVLVLSLLLIFSAYTYLTVDFLGSKISGDSGRLNFNFFESADFFQTLAGYGVDPNSFKTSSLESASSLFNLFKYYGAFGFIIFMSNLFMNKTPYPLLYFTIMSLILMNEPFLSNSPIFWGLGFVTYTQYQVNNRN